jgi:hypothetical protein
MRSVRPTHTALLCYALAFCQAFWAIGCSDRISGSGTGSSSTIAGILGNHSLGEVIYGVWHGEITQEPAGSARDARLAALEARRADFVRAVDDIVNARTLQAAGNTADALFALVDDGTLPRFAGLLADTLEDLLADGQAMDAVTQLLRDATASQAGASIPRRQALELFGRLTNFPESAQLWEAIVQLIEENDGVDAQGNPNGEPKLVQDLLRFLSDALARPVQPQASSRVSQALDDLLTKLTAEARIRGNLGFGDPAWVVRLDARDLPQVATDAVGRPLAPFVDLDGDGLADIDGQRRFVDASGQPLDLPTFGQPNSTGFGPDGRALGPGGGDLYLYADAKRTVLSLLLANVGDLLARDAAGLSYKVLTASLGAPPATGGYADSPIHDLAWAFFELLEPDVALQGTRAFVDLLNRDPDTAERILVAVAKANNAAHTASQASSSGARLSDPAMVQLVDDLIPLLDDLFESPVNPTNPRSTALTVGDTLASLRTTAPDFAHKIAPLFVYTAVVRESAPDGDLNDIDEARSTPVDFTQGPSANNRSAIQQLLDLLARASGCNLFGKNLAVWILELMAGLSPSTVGNLASLTQAIPGFLQNLVCSGISNDIQALDALAKSGALDGLLPIAKAFEDRDEMPLLVELLVKLQVSYDQTTRAIEPTVKATLEAGALDALLELVEISNGVVDPVSGKTLAESMSAATEILVDDDAVVLDRWGNRVPTTAHLVIRPLQELDRRVAAAGRDAEMSQLIDATIDVLFATTVVNGQEVLRNGSLVPLVGEALGGLQQALPADPVARRAEIDRAQQDVFDLLTSRDLVTILDLLGTIDAAPSRDLITRSLRNLFTPRLDPAQDVFGALLRVLVITLQAPPQPGPFQDLAPFLSRTLDPSNPAVLVAVETIQRILTADRGQTLLSVLRAALNPAPGDIDPPAEVLLQIFDEVQGAGGGSSQAVSRAQLESDLRSTVHFLRDDPDGLASIFDTIRNRVR